MSRANFVLRSIALIGALMAAAMGIWSYATSTRASLEVVGRRRLRKGTLESFWEQLQPILSEAMERAGRGVALAGVGASLIGERAKKENWAGRVLDTLGDGIRLVALTVGASAARRQLTIVRPRRRVRFLTRLQESIGDMVDRVMHVPGLLLAGIVAVLGTVFGAILALLGALLWAGILGLFIAFVFAPEREQRRELFRRLQPAFRGVESIYRQIASLFQGMRREAGRGIGEHRAA